MSGKPKKPRRPSPPKEAREPREQKLKRLGWFAAETQRLMAWATAKPQAQKGYKHRIIEHARDIVDGTPGITDAAPKIFNALLKHVSWGKGFARVSAATMRRGRRRVGEATAKRALFKMERQKLIIRYWQPSNCPGYQGGGETVVAATALPVLLRAAYELVEEGRLAGSWSDHQRSDYEFMVGSGRELTVGSGRESWSDHY